VRQEALEFDYGGRIRCRLAHTNIFNLRNSEDQST